MTKEPAWRLQRASSKCEIKNPLGRFELRVYELTNRSTHPVEVLGLSVGAAKNGMYLRVNSACTTSEIFGDVRCDCNWQLWQCMKLLSADEAGLILYAPSDEGRGVGIFNKVESMMLMSRDGISSSESFRRLGLPVDARDYSYVPPILSELGVSAIRCITNNLGKVQALSNLGIRVIEKIPIVAPSNSEIASCIRDKIGALGHVMPQPD